MFKWVSILYSGYTRYLPTKTQVVGSYLCKRGNKKVQEIGERSGNIKSSGSHNLQKDDISWACHFFLYTNMFMVVSNRLGCIPKLHMHKNTQGGLQYMLSYYAFHKLFKECLPIIISYPQSLFFVFFCFLVLD